MWTMFEMMLVQVAVTALRLIIKSPTATAEEAKVIADLALGATAADNQFNGAQWSNAAPAPKAATP